MRSCKDYVFNKEAQYGTHQKIERNIAQRKYTLDDIRQGYNIPFSTQWHFMEYRCKKEIIAEFTNDLTACVLNPTPNKTNFIGLFRSNKMRSVGRLFYLIQYLFKWSNRFPFKYFNPIKPVPIIEKKQPNKFLNNSEWAYTYVFGYLEDPTEEITDDVNNEVYKQKDVL